MGITKKAKNIWFIPIKKMGLPNFYSINIFLVMHFIYHILGFFYSPYIFTLLTGIYSAHQQLLSNLSLLQGESCQKSFIQLKLLTPLFSSCAQTKSRWTPSAQDITILLEQNYGIGDCRWQRDSTQCGTGAKVIQVKSPSPSRSQSWSSLLKAEHRSTGIEVWSHSSLKSGYCLCRVALYCFSSRATIMTKISHYRAYGLHYLSALKNIVSKASLAECVVLFPIYRLLFRAYSLSRPWYLVLLCSLFHLPFVFPQQIRWEIFTYCNTWFPDLA